MNLIKILTVNDESYQICDPDAAHIDDTATDGTTTWSSAKLDGMLGAVEAGLDSILAIQNELMGGAQ